MENHNRRRRQRSGRIVRATGYGLAWLAWSWWGTIALQAADGQRPNVVIVLADDLGYSDLGCYGGEIRTTNLDAIAADGLRYTQFYNTARCWPTRAALMTGYYAQQVRRDQLPDVEATPEFPASGQGIRPRWAPLLSQMLRGWGYRNYHSGKWHLDGQPLANGFDHSYVLDDHNRLFAPQAHSRDGQALPAVGVNDGYYATTAIADHAVECLRDHARSFPDRPFFQFVAFTAPHFPLQAPADDIERYREHYRSGWDALRGARWQRCATILRLRGQLSDVEPEVGPPYEFPQVLSLIGPSEMNRYRPWDELRPDQQQWQAHKMAIHAAMVDRMDQEVGRICAQLRSMGAWEQTWFIFLSDNGASAEMMVRGDGHNRYVPAGADGSFVCLGPAWSSVANTPFRRHKTWVHEGGIATPCIVHPPAAIGHAGELRHAVGHVIDLVPTILELVGSDDREAGRRPGQSLVPTFANDVPLARAPLWWYHDHHRAIREGDWKAISRDDSEQGGWALFDLSYDRSETRDVAAFEPARVTRLSAQWESMAAAFRQHVRSNEAPPLPARP